MNRISISVATLLLWVCAARARAGSCEDLRQLKLTDTTITSAEAHAAGTEQLAVTGPPGVTLPPMRYSVPAYCRVKGVIRPTSDSQIEFELWLPQDHWNHRYQQVGNGGLAGSIPLASLVDPLQHGWAVAGTDDGHTGADMSDGRWALGHPEKVKDFGYRAVHLTALRAQSLVRAYYRAKTSHRYFVGCSDGGRESLMEAQRYPTDFDGFVAGAPAIDVALQSISAVDKAQTQRSLEGQALTSAQVALLRDRALAQCDSLDGVTDGIIAEPRRCGFKPAQLQCGTEPSPGCLSVAQVAALQHLNDGVRDPDSGAVVVYGMADSVGTGEAAAVLTADARPNPLAKQLLGNLLYQQPDLDIYSIDIVKASRDAAPALNPLINPSDVNLAAAHRAGKKIIQYHGWWDPLISPQSSLRYFDAVQTSMGDTRDFYRLFLVPGMGHCGGGAGNAWIMGPGVTHDADHDVVEAMTRWVEQGEAPDQLISSRFDSAGVNPILGPQAGTPVKSSWTLCPYPQVASGSAGDLRCPVARQ